MCVYISRYVLSKNRLITTFFADDMLSLTVRNTVQRSLGRLLSSSIARAKEHLLDPLQEAALNEKCFLVDVNDNVIGHGSKRECHLVAPDGSLPLHRAFSVFVFSNNGNLLLQKRSSVKVNMMFFIIRIKSKGYAKCEI